MKTRFEALVKKCEERKVATRQIVWGTLELQLKGEDYNSFGETGMAEVEKCWAGDGEVAAPPRRRRRTVQQEVQA